MNENVEKVYLGKHTDRFFIAKSQEDLVIVIPKGADGDTTTKVVLDEMKDSYKMGEVIGLAGN